MIRNHEEDDFVAVRVQDPRIQNEGSWNSYVDYKIFLHTNSKAFTAKTSCVRRRYSEFVWLKKQLQKNAGLVPVPDLPGKSFLSFSNEDFLEKRRKGLQAFLDKVVHTTVCLSDSQLHLFLQTQLPAGHIQDCVQGHTPYSVTDAILTYASSNQGLVQAQDDDSIKEPSLTVSYESMESPAPRQPCLQTEEIVGDPDPPEGLLDLRDERRAQKKSSVKISEKENLLEAVVEFVREPVATFFLGDDREDGESLAEETPQTSCGSQTPGEGHSPGQDCGVDSVFEESSVSASREGKAVHVTHMEETAQANSSGNLNCEECVSPAVFKVEASETEGSIQAADSHAKTVAHWSEGEASMQMSGYPDGKENICALEKEDLQYVTSLRLASSVAGEDLTESGDFSIFETGLTISKHAASSLDSSEETQSGGALLNGCCTFTGQEQCVERL